MYHLRDFISKQNSFETQNLNSLVIFDYYGNKLKIVNHIRRLSCLQGFLHG